MKINRALFILKPGAGWRPRQSAFTRVLTRKTLTKQNKLHRRFCCNTYFHKGSEITYAAFNTAAKSIPRHLHNYLPT